MTRLEYGAESRQPTFREWIGVLFEPAWIMKYAATALLAVLFEVVFQQGKPLEPIVNFEKVKDDGFARFWNAFSVPPKPGQKLTGSATLIPPLFESANGQVLHVGPGNGAQVSFFANADVDHIYAAEPAIGLHGKLRGAVEDAGLTGKYTILACKADIESLTPALAKVKSLHGSVEEGVFDAIVFVRVLCGIPEPEKTIEDLYRLLKPGGRFLVAEHVVNPWMSGQGNVVARTCQMFYMMIGWAFFINGCRLTRDTASSLRAAARNDGGWGEDALQRYFGWSPIPYVAGHLQKRKL